MSDNDTLKLPSFAVKTASAPDVKTACESDAKTPSDVKTARESTPSDVKTAREPDEKPKAAVSPNKPVEKKDPFRLKCVVVGDPLVGKTSLLHAFVNNASIETNSRHLMMPGIMDVCEKEVVSENQMYTLILQDTGYNKDRITHYSDADIILMCYAVGGDVNSLRQIEKKWVPELKENAPGKPYILVGCKSDLRSLSKMESCMVGEFDGMHISASIDSQAFFECSAKSLENVKRIFVEVCDSTVRHRLLTTYSQIATLQPNAPPLTTSIIVYRPLSAFQTLAPIAKQLYHNLWDCITNKGAFVERKKTIVSYMPILKSWIAYEEEAIPAKDSAEVRLPEPTNKIQDAQLKRLMDDEEAKGPLDVPSKRKKDEEK